MTMIREVALALTDAGYQGLEEFIMEHGEVPATADPVGVSDAVLNAFLGAPGSLENSLAAAHAALVAENERLRAALDVARDHLSRHCDINDGSPNREMSVLNEVKAILGEIP